MVDELDEAYWEALEPGTLCEYEWKDITADSVGDPDLSAVTYRRSLGWYWGIKDDERGSTVVTFALTSDAQGSHQSGWDCLPVECVMTVEILKRPRKRRSRKKSSPGDTPDVPSAIGPADSLVGESQEDSAKSAESRHGAGVSDCTPASSSRGGKK